MLCVFEGSMGRSGRAKRAGEDARGGFRRRSDELGSHDGSN